MTDTAARFASATFAVVLTLATLAYCIVPATPGLMA
jgi:hypothetical protein